MSLFKGRKALEEDIQFGVGDGRSGSRCVVAVAAHGGDGEWYGVAKRRLVRIVLWGAAAKRKVYDRSRARRVVREKMRFFGEVVREKLRVREVVKAVLRNGLMEGMA